MTNIRIVGYLLSMSLFLAACGDGGSAEQNGEELAAASEQMQDSLWQQMMNVHDEVMPQMGEMNRVSQDLKAKAAELEDEAQSEPIEEVAESLDQAHEGMMEWMSNLQPLDKVRAEMGTDEVNSYLKAETEKIAKVKEDMMTSLAKGKAVLAELEAEAKEEE